MRILHGSGSGRSLLLPREVADRGLVNWPKCGVCLRAVDAYGLGEHVPGRYIEFWARCDGIAGLSGGRHARSYRAGIRIDLSRFASGWTANTQTDILRRLMLSPGVFGKWALRLGDPDMVRPA